MPANNITLVKYVFLDIVAYTKRTIEAQCYLIGTLNRIVKGTINRYHISNDSVTYIPTGDGMCIALLGTNLPYDIHITIAKEVLRRIHVNNSRVTADWKKFVVRVGINQCDDNIVTDINDRKNVTGAGINNARRIMDLADASQILVSNIVFENLHPRKAYNHAFSQEFQHEVKHGLVLKTYQLVEPDANWLNVDTPLILAKKVKPEPKLTKLIAYYFAHSIKNRKFLLGKRGYPENDVLLLLLWYLAIDSLGKANSTAIEPYNEHMPTTINNTLDEQFEVFSKIPVWVCGDLRDLVRTYKIGEDYYKYFEDGSDFIIVNADGREKLKSEWPDIWDELKLDEVSG